MAAFCASSTLNTPFKTSRYLFTGPSSGWVNNVCFADVWGLDVGMKRRTYAVAESEVMQRRQTNLAWYTLAVTKVGRKDSPATTTRARRIRYSVSATEDQIPHLEKRRRVRGTPHLVYLVAILLLPFQTLDKLVLL